MSTSIPDFSKLAFDGTAADGGASRAAWEKAAQAAANGKDLVWHTPEQIDVQPFYSAQDLAGVEHLKYMPGLAPFVRGPYATMYVQQPWTVRQYAGFSTAEDSNAFYRR
ncbi:MAG TPA: methylmalonyl-CoA mutase family protein, partial [Polyangiales bacterium]|nr:methylmalonyl-CoA mutase family protein [Polyangiales bacterium]